MHNKLNQAVKQRFLSCSAKLATELRDAITIFMLTQPQSPVNDPGGDCNAF